MDFSNTSGASEGTPEVSGLQIMLCNFMRKEHGCIVCQSVEDRGQEMNRMYRAI